MNISPFPFQTFQWADLPIEQRPGETGFASWQVMFVGSIRIRRVVYSPNYKADHWCSKGHIMYCISGEMNTELDDGRIFHLSKGMSYVVGDHSEPHRSFTSGGCELFVVD